jgi:hypothetical protein
LKTLKNKCINVSLESAKAADETQKAANEASAAKGKEYFKCKKLKT